MPCVGVVALHVSEGDYLSKCKAMSGAEATWILKTSLPAQILKTDG